MEATMSPGIAGLIDIAILFYLAILPIIIMIAMAIWVYKDSNKRYPEGSSTPLIWLIIVLFTGLLGFIVYLLVRPKEIRKEDNRV